MIMIIIIITIKTRTIIIMLLRVVNYSLDFLDKSTRYQVLVKV